MAKILVTGTTGFIGRFLVSYLLTQSVSVRILVRNHLRDDFPVTVQQVMRSYLSRICRDNSFNMVSQSGG